MIVVDDLGYAEVACPGCTDVATPHIDSIAVEGVRFTAGYATCSLCAPTRAALMVGRYQQRFGFEHNPGPRQITDPAFGLPTGVPTLAERLRDAGYATGAIGKWHLGYREGSRPLDRGFQEFFGFLGGVHTYGPMEPGKSSKILRGTEPVLEREYLTRAFARESMAFIRAHADEPFLLYSAFNAVHDPLDPDPATEERVAGIADEKRRKFASMLVSLDDAVGEILAALREHELDQRTLVFFLSDNGGPTRQTSSSNAPFSGHKGVVYEGGIRVPYFMRWIGHLPAGRVYGNPVSTMDVYPTALAAAGLRTDEDTTLDGVDLLPFLAGERKGTPHEALFWRLGDQSAVRMGEWKLVMRSGRSDALFDLRTDHSEQVNLSSEQPEKLQELRAAYREWEKEMIPAKCSRKEDEES